LCAVLVGATSALAGVEFPSVIDRVVGIRTDAGAGDFVVSGRRGLPCAEAGDVELFGIAGLRVSGARASSDFGACSVGASASQLMSPVGSETRAYLEGGYQASARWLCAVRAGTEIVSIEGPGESALVTGVFSRANLGAVSAIADVDVVSRESGRDVDVTLGVVARAGRTTTIVGSARFDGTQVVAAGVALVSRLAGALALLAGYDDGTESVRGAAVVSLSRWRVSTGVFYHGVLGVSHGVTVAWTR
jgi:hypothetical protein